MPTSRRTFLGAAIGAGLAANASSEVKAKNQTTRDGVDSVRDRFDPWIEVIPEHLAFNVEQVSRLTSGRPILPVEPYAQFGSEISG